MKNLQSDDFCPANITKHRTAKLSFLCHVHEGHLTAIWILNAIFLKFKGAKLWGITWRRPYQCFLFFFNHLLKTQFHRSLISVRHVSERMDVNKLNVSTYPWLMYTSSKLWSTLCFQKCHPKILLLFYFLY